jgi:hypothetical protein
MNELPHEKNEVSADATVTLTIPYEVWLDFITVLSLAKETQDNKTMASDCLDWMESAVDNYDGVPVDFFSNRKTVVSNRTGRVVYLT